MWTIKHQTDSSMYAIDFQQGTSLPHNQTVMPPGLIWFVYTMDDSLLILSHNLMKVEKFKSLEKKTIYD